MKVLKYTSLLTILIALIGGFFYYDLGSYLTLDYLKDQKDYFLGMIKQNPTISVAIFAGIYIATTALSLPGAAILTLAGGALFGLLWGTLIVSFASTIGATLAFLVSRFLLGNTIQKKFSDKLKTVNEGIESEGAFYLFTMRLVPVIPFFVINLVMGLTKISTKAFFFVSQVGMLPGTMVYVNAGTELGKLDSLQGILSPSLILSFVILGTFPIAVKKLINWIRND